MYKKTLQISLHEIKANSKLDEPFSSDGQKLLEVLSQYDTDTIPKNMTNF